MFKESELAQRVVELENQIKRMEEKRREEKEQLRNYHHLMKEIVMSSDTTLTPEFVSKAFDLMERSDG